MNNDKNPRSYEHTKNKRISRKMLPNEQTICAKKNCKYQQSGKIDGSDELSCFSPMLNKKNQDAVCFKIQPGKLKKLLTTAQFG